MIKNNSFSILIVDDELEYRKSFEYMLKAKGYTTYTAADGEEALEKLGENDIDLVMTDLKMPGIDGIELVEKIKSRNQEIEIIIITAFGTVESAVKAIKHGATGYFIKSNNPESLLIDISRIAKVKALAKSNELLKKEKNGDVFLETKNAKMKELLQICDKVADSDISVLILGESGVGKEIFARYIHEKSPRKDNMFIPVNCQAFPDNMVESELFGFEKGSFTGAAMRRIGRFEEANQGTIFLDEIGDLPASTQGKILRTIENKVVERIGSNKPIGLDIRLITATNKDLNKKVKEGLFREDLLYRINPITLIVPPLRERKEDLPSLIDFFVTKISREQKKNITDIEKTTMAYLLDYNYPGNIRELKNIIERLIVLNEDGILKHRNLLFNETKDNALMSVSEFEGLRSARSKFEKEYIEMILKSTKNNIQEAADILNISRRQLSNKIANYNIKKQ